MSFSTFVLIAHVDSIPQRTRYMELSQKKIMPPYLPRQRGECMVKIAKTSVLKDHFRSEVLKKYLCAISYNEKQLEIRCLQ